MILKKKMEVERSKLPDLRCTSGQWDIAYTYGIEFKNRFTYIYSTDLQQWWQNNSMWIKRIFSTIRVGLTG